MRYQKCEKCGGTISENDTNPAVHYSKPQTICDRCRREEACPPGTWLQDKNGNYYQKDNHGDK